MVNVILTLCIATTVISIAVAIKEYIAALTASYILSKYGITPDDNEIRCAAVEVAKRLLKMR